MDEIVLSETIIEPTPDCSWTAHAVHSVPESAANFFACRFLSSNDSIQTRCGNSGPGLVRHHAISRPKHQNRRLRATVPQPPEQSGKHLSVAICCPIGVGCFVGTVGQYDKRGIAGSQVFGHHLLLPAKENGC